MFSGWIDLKNMNVIDSNKTERDAGGKPHPLSSSRFSAQRPYSMIELSRCRIVFMIALMIHAWH
ncbi:hypothetical protein CN168_26260 [Sinorhizobium medicae]|nr:hypothetical protein CN168_26260 [Sinorhizobium medicae]RVO79971.1 hypothetical protein CN084_09795 [Sinorhizobium medicae]